jgi:hypothetical protein
VTDAGVLGNKFVRRQAIFFDVGFAGDAVLGQEVSPADYAQVSAADAAAHRLNAIRFGFRGTLSAARCRGLSRFHFSLGSYARLITSLEYGRTISRT